MTASNYFCHMKCRERGLVQKVERYQLALGLLTTGETKLFASSNCYPIYQKFSGFQFPKRMDLLLLLLYITQNLDSFGLGLLVRQNKKLKDVNLMAVFSCFPL